MKWLGRATGKDEVFEFTIEPFVAGGFRLDIKYSGSCHHNIVGAGIWPSIEKAKEIAQGTAAKLLNGAEVYWNSESINTNV